MLLWCVLQTGILSQPEESGKVVNFRASGGMELQGEFAFPKEPGARPAILLLPGSGPTDRNGNQLPSFRTDLLKELSDYFVSKGFVTFRFDKRAAASALNIRQFPKTPAGYGDFFSFERFEGDVMAAYRTLRFHPRVRPQQVMIAGHSEGGLLAMTTRARLKPHALILLGTPGRTFGDILIEQVDQGMVRQRVPEPLATDIKTNNRAIIESLRAGKTFEGQIHPALRTLYNPSVANYMKTAVNLDPKNFPAPSGDTLIINGGSDIQVNPDRDAMRLHGIFKGSELVIIPSASHNFKRVADPEKEQGFTGPVMPELFAALDRWLAKRPS